MSHPLRCDLTELYVSECAHCRRIVDEPPTQRGPWVPAQWPGFCAACGEEFASGEQIRSDGAGGWTAECCGEAGT